MRRTITQAQASANLGDTLDCVHRRGDEIVIERDGEPIAAVIPMERYQALEESRERLFAFIDRAHELNKDVPEEVLLAEIDAAVAEARQEMRSSR